MLKRCYDNNSEVNPTYDGCTVCKEWHCFSIFKAWMETQDWEGKDLDKDILLFGNKEYCPDACVFITKNTNNFVWYSEKKAGEWPAGVHYSKKAKKFISKISWNGKTEHLGTYDTPEDAHEAWLSAKLKQACTLASQQTDERVAKALIDRYENYKLEVL